MEDENKEFWDDEMPIEDGVGLFDDSAEPQKPHKKVSYEPPVNETEAEKPKKKKKGFLSDFVSGVAAGAKVFSDNVKAGAEAVAEGAKNEKEDGFDETVEEPAEEPAYEPVLEENPETDVPEEPTLTVDDIPEPAIFVEPPMVSRDEDYEEYDDGESETGEEETDEGADDDFAEKKPSAMESFSDKLAGISSKGIIIGAVAIVAVLIGVIVLFANGCERKPAEEDLPPIEDVDVNDDGNIIDEDGKEIPLVIPTRAEEYAAAKEINPDVVGWLYIPGLSDVDAGVCHDPKTYSYNKRDITGKSVNSTYWINGAYYAHLRNNFGAEIKDLSKNTVIFGHSDLGSTNLAYADDDPTGPLFSQLFNFKNPDFAAQTPYIFLTTEAGDTIWEIFAVFYNDSALDGGRALWYIEPEPGDSFANVVNLMRERSLYDYDVELYGDDKILTLSTCTVGFGLGSRSKYRFVISARLVTDTENLVEKKAGFTINADAPVPSSFQTQFSEYAANWKMSEKATNTDQTAPAADSGSDIVITDATAAA